MLPTPREPCSRRLQPPVIVQPTPNTGHGRYGFGPPNDSTADRELTIAVPMPECGYQLPEREVP